MSSARRSCVVGVAMVVMLQFLTACSSPPPVTFDPQRTDIRLERSRVRVEVTSTLATVTAGRVAVASAWMDQCDPSRSPAQPWSRECSYEHAVALTWPDMAAAARALQNGLTEAGCREPRVLTRQLDGWAMANPGEPAPGDEDFQPGVVAPEVTACGSGELWIRVSAPDDPLLDRTISAAADSTSALVVTARPFDQIATEQLHGSSDRVIVLVSMTSPYHREPR